MQKRKMVLAVLFVLGSMQQAVCMQLSPLELAKTCVGKKRVRKLSGQQPGQSALWQVPTDVVFTFSSRESCGKSGVSQKQPDLWSLLQEKMNDYNVIRCARQTDHLAVKTIFTQNFSGVKCPWDDSYCLVLVIRGEVQGFVQYRKYGHKTFSDIDCADSEIDYLALAKAFRRQGYGKQLLRAACEDLLKRSCACVGLFPVFNSTGFYEKCGFQRTGDPYVPSYLLPLKECRALHT